MFQFFLQNDNINGGFPLQIEEPIGWKDIEFIMKRDRKFHGFLNEISLPLKFIGDAYAVLFNFFQNFGPDNEIKLTVKFECGRGFDTIYTGMIALSRSTFGYDKGLCFVDAHLENDTAKMVFWNRINQKINLLDSKSFDKSTTLDAYARAPYDVTLQGKTILKQNLFKKLDLSNFYTGTSYYTIPLGIGTQIAGSTLWMQWGWDTKVFEELPSFQGLTNQNGFITGSCDGGACSSLPPPIFVCTEAGDYAISFCITLDGYVDVYTGAELVFSGYEHDYDGLDMTVAFKKLATDPPLPGGLWTIFAAEPSPHNGPNPGDNLHTFHAVINYSGVVHLEIGEELRLYMASSVQGDYDNDPFNSWPWSQILSVDFSEACCFSMKLNSEFEPTVAKVFAVNEAFSKIVESLTNKQMRVLSDYFGRTDSLPYERDAEGCGAFTTVANGLMLRGRLLSLSDEESLCGETVPETIYNGMQISFEDLFDALNACFNIGFSYEDPPDATYAPDTIFVVRIEAKDYFYDKLTPPIIELSGLNVWRLKVLNEEYFSKILGGYDKWEAEDYNSIDEFNTAREYSTLLKFNNNELDIRCKFIGGSYAIEITRRQQNTADFKYDNDSFILCVKQSVATMNEAEQAENATELIPGAGLIDGSNSYNLRIAPQRNLFRWFSILMNINHIVAQTLKEGNDREQYLMDFGDCCADYTYLLANDEFPKWSEDALSLCSAAFYKLSELSCEYPLTYEEYKYLKTIPYSRVQISNSGAANGVYFIREIRYKPHTGIAKFTLIPEYLG